MSCTKKAFRYFTRKKFITKLKTKRLNNLIKTQNLSIEQNDIELLGIFLFEFVIAIFAVELYVITDSEVYVTSSGDDKDKLVLQSKLIDSNVIRLWEKVDADSNTFALIDDIHNKVIEIIQQIGKEKGMNNNEIEKFTKFVIGTIEKTRNQ